MVRVSMCQRILRRSFFSETGIENVITESGGYEYRNGGTERARRRRHRIVLQPGRRSIQPSEVSLARTKYVAFVNLREIRWHQIRHFCAAGV